MLAHNTLSAQISALINITTGAAQAQASAIGATLVQLKYRIAVMNGVIKEQR